MRAEAVAPMDSGCASRVCLRNVITACAGMQASNSAAAASQAQKRRRQPYWLPPAVRMAKRGAIALFASQLTGPPGSGAILPPRVLARFHRPFEVLLP